MNTIPQTQNESGQIERLAAQRQLYSDAKFHQSLLITATIISVVAALITPFVPELRSWASKFGVVVPQLEVWAALFGLLVMLYEYLLATPAQNALRERAARTQELFDCDVLQLPWMEHAAGHKPTPEEVHEAFNRYKKTEPDLKSLVDWYPVEVGELPLHLARLICQRSSCRWDGSIRKRFANAFLGVVLVIVTVALSISVWKEMKIAGVLLGVAVPLLPTISLGIKQFKEQQDAANAVNTLREHLESTWEKALKVEMNETDATASSREIQTEIFHHRRKSPLVFDKVYKVLRDSNEEQMNVGAHEYIVQARKHLNLPPLPENK